MAYTLKHPIWFPNRSTHTINKFGIEPNSKFLYTENELKGYMDSATMMSQALLNVSTQITDGSAELIATKNSDESYTDGKSIVIGMNPVNYYKDIWTGMDIEIGLACHESCHCAYTDFNDYTLRKVTIPFAHWIHNVYEDECIEEMLGLKYTQWMYFLNCVISHYFNEDKFLAHAKKLSAINSKSTDIDIAQFMLLYMIRQSKLSNRFPQEWLDKFGMMLDEIYEKVIVELEDPKLFKYSPTVNTARATIDTIEIMKKYIDMSELTKKLSMPMLGHIGNATTEGDPNKVDPKAKSTCGENGLYAPNNKKERNKSAASIQKRTESAKKKAELEEKQKQSEREAKDGKPTPPNELFKGANSKIGAAKPKGSHITLYKDYVNKLREEINIAKKIIIANTKKLDLVDDNFHRTGQLIPNQLAQAIQGVNCVYHRKVVKTSDNKDPKYALVLALDESGSMHGACHEIATRLAIIFYEAMKDYPGIDLYIYGHGDNVVKYVTPKNKRSFIAVSDRRIQNGQNESMSYRAILSDVRLHTNKPILFMNITDSLYLDNSDNITNFIRSTKSKNLQYGLIEINGIQGMILHQLPQFIQAKELNDELYGKGNWVEIRANGNVIRDALKNLAKIIRKNYDLKCS